VVLIMLRVVCGRMGGGLGVMWCVCGVWVVLCGEWVVVLSVLWCNGWWGRV
jgi:hypothetical protein